MICVETEMSATSSRDARKTKTNEVKHNVISVLDVPPHQDEEGHSVDSSSSGRDRLVGDVTQDVPIKEEKRQSDQGRFLRGATNRRKN